MLLVRAGCARYVRLVMGRVTTTRTNDQDNRVIGQSFWLLGTMTAAVIIVSMMGQSLAQAENLRAEQPYTSQELLELADRTTSSAESGEPATTTTIEATPAAPSVTSADAGISDPATSTVPPTSAGPDTSGAAVADTPDADGSTEAQDFGFGATTSVVPAGETSSESSVDARGQAALATISYPWQELLTDWTVVFLPEEPGLYGLTKVPDRRIEIYVRDDQSIGLLAHVVAHEIGHAVDVTFNTGPDRRLWEETRGLTAPWWPDSGATDFRTGAGDFAESFASWQVGDGSFRSELGPPPTAAQIAILAQLAAG